MAFEESLNNITLNADASLAVYTGVAGQPGAPSDHGGKQYTFVKVTGAKTAGLATAAANEVVVGVLQNKPQYVGVACTVAISGVSQVRAGAAVTAGVPLKVDGSGRAVTATLPADAALVVGIALTGCTGADHIISALLRVNG